jgi:hypothetical protein
MKINVILFILLGAFLVVSAGCSSTGTEQVPPPTAQEGNDTRIKYAQWTNGQLELKRAQLRHELDRGYINAGSPGMVLLGQMDRGGQQDEVEEIEAELLRRDPSGGLLEKSNSLLADRSQDQ